MEPWLTALLGFAGLLFLIGLGWPIAFAMLITGALGSWSVLGWRATVATLGQTVSMTAVSYELSVVPMFILMGALVARSGASEALYLACYRFLGPLRGGLAMATVVACGGFAAVCGSSIATAAAMARVAMPSMRRFGYDDGLASGAIAAGGTLGILIPPSVIMVIYGIQTGTDIGHLFIAGIIPGLIGILFYVAAIAAVAGLRPRLGPPGERSAARDKWLSLLGTAPILALFLLVIFGIYLGWFTPTEAAGVGAFGALAHALAARRLPWRAFLDALLETARTTANLFFILIGAIVFSNFMNLTGLPELMRRLVTAWGWPPLGVIALITLIYLVLGCFVESLSMVLLTVPIFFPVVTALGFDPIWFGIYVVFMTELSLITPPVGLNLFVIKGVVGDIGLSTVYRGILPFIVADLFRLALLIFAPAIALYLPRLAAR